MTLTADKIRKKFLAYFEKNGHTVKPSASLIPEDKTVLLTIAGMIPFKPYFMGERTPPFSRACSVQKCIRTNDIDNVGKTHRHQTFFEMLGNFSFGDYFKKEAINYAWDFLTNHLKIPKEKLWVSVYQEDNEAHHLWLEQTDLEESKLIRLGKGDNFWESGPTGPCGPCSEIYYDYGTDPTCHEENCGPGCDCNRFVEIWNLVFMEYNQDEKGELTPLPNKNIDTGMGLERITSVMQNVQANFDTDLFVPLINRIKLLTNIDKTESIRVVADHIRAVVFLIADGVFPSNEGRGYVLKKILRRAIRHGKLLDINDAFIVDLAEDVINNYGDFYNELKDKKDFILDIVKNEEDNFSKTLDFGLTLLEELIVKKQEISGESAFKLFDTYGFPLELTLEIAEEKGIKVDTERFGELMHEQRARARTTAKFYKDGKKPSGGEAIIAQNDSEKNEMARNHSATHLLQSALRETLGTHVEQAGSMVSPERLRFDFKNPKALTPKQITKVEKLVNNFVLANFPVDISFRAYDEAINDGAIGLFTDKYDEEVRVVKMGDVSMELCGGTHVSRTGDIGLFKIVGESAISSGVRRIEALTGSYALDFVNERVQIIQDIANTYKVKVTDLEPKYEQLVNDNNALKKKLQRLQGQVLVQALADKTPEDINGTPVFIQELNTDNSTNLNTKQLADDLHQKKQGLIALFVKNPEAEKISLIIKTSQDLIDKGIQASQLVKKITPIIDGSGGGRPDFAQGGGKDFSKISEAITQLKDIIREKLS